MANKEENAGEVRANAPLLLLPPLLFDLAVALSAAARTDAVVVAIVATVELR